ncbi:MAG: LytTR family DNA-binding domain-containing protein [Ruthenibacterium sp.]
MILEIAICDDDMTDLQQIETAVAAYQAENASAQISVYSTQSPAALAEKIAHGERSDIYILDLMMPEIDGISLGKIIRNSGCCAPIIYITSSNEHAFEAYGVCALRYLMKPVAQADMFAALDFARHNLAQHSVKHFHVKTKEGIQKIAVADIVCVENIQRSMQFTMQDGTKVNSVCNRESFETHLAPLLADDSFAQPHKSFLVHMKFVQSLQPDTLLLDSGLHVPISRNYASDLKRRYLKYLARSER